MPKQHEEGGQIAITCRSCGHVIKGYMPVPELIQDLTATYQNELDWYRQRIAELEEEILVLKEWDN